MLRRAGSILLSRGLRPWYGVEWKSQELERPSLFRNKPVSANNQEMRECGKDRLGVGLIHSSDEAGNDRGAKGLALICKGDGTHSPNTALEKLWKQNYTL